VQIFRLFERRATIIVSIVVGVALIGWLFAYEPVTRQFVASESVCGYCHLEREYVPATRLSFSTAHPLEPKRGETAAQCVDCHLPEGFWAATFTYTHFASVTDLYGHFRDRASEREGDWIPPSAARAYRVRDRMFAEDSDTCRTCHIESEIEPKRDRGKNAHKNALVNKETCIECHNNLVHRFVEVRRDAFKKPAASLESSTNSIAGIQ
jgi:cytochrome c-type protein NapC